MGSKVSTYGDVYSYGILILEMFTRKRPTDEMFKDALSLHEYVKNALPRQISQVLDPLFAVGGAGEEDDPNSLEICKRKDQRQECLVAILGVGVACSVETPRERMDITNVIKELKLVRKTLIEFSSNYNLFQAGSLNSAKKIKEEI